MRELMRTEYTPTTVIMPDGKQVAGASYFHVLLVEAGDSGVRPNGTPIAPLSTHRSGRGVAVVEEPPPAFKGTRAVTVPASVLDPLPDDALVEFEWRFERGNK